MGFEFCRRIARIAHNFTHSCRFCAHTQSAHT